MAIRYLIGILLSFFAIELVAQQFHRWDITDEIGHCTHNNVPVEFGGIPIPGCMVITDATGRQFYGQPGIRIIGDSLVQFITRNAFPTDTLFRQAVEISTGGGSFDNIYTVSDSIDDPLRYVKLDSSTFWNSPGRQELYIGHFGTTPSLDVGENVQKMGFFINNSTDVPGGRQGTGLFFSNPQTLISGDSVRNFAFVGFDGAFLHSELVNEPNYFELEVGTSLGFAYRGETVSGSFGYRLATSSPAVSDSMVMLWTGPNIVPNFVSLDDIRLDTVFPRSRFLYTDYNTGEITTDGATAIDSIEVRVNGAKWLELQDVNFMAGRNNFEVNNGNIFSGIGIENFENATSVSNSFAQGNENFHDLLVGSNNFGQGYRNFFNVVSNNSSSLFAQGDNNLNDAVYAYYVFVQGRQNGTPIDSLVSTVIIGNRNAFNTTATSAFNTILMGDEVMHNSTSLNSSMAFGYRAGYNNTADTVILFGDRVEATEDNQVAFSDVYNSLKAHNYIWNVQQDTTALDGYVMTYDGPSNKLELKPTSGDTDTNFALNDLTADDDRAHDWDNNELSITAFSLLDLQGVDMDFVASNEIQLVAPDINLDAPDIFLVDPLNVNNTLDSILVRDNVTGEIFARSASSIGGGTDTNFAEDNLTADNNRSHDWAGFDYSLTNFSQYTIQGTDILFSQTGGADDITISNGEVQFRSDGFIESVTPSFEIKNGVAVAVLKLFESTAGGGNFIGLDAPALVGSDYTYTLPLLDGSNGDFMITDGAGNLSFTAGPSDLHIGNSNLTTTDNTRTLDLLQQLLIREDGASGNLLQINPAGGRLAWEIREPGGANFEMLSDQGDAALSLTSDGDSNDHPTIFFNRDGGLSDLSTSRYLLGMNDDDEFELLKAIPASSSLNAVFTVHAVDDSLDIFYDLFLPNENEVDNNLDSLLVINPATGEVKLREASSIGGGGGDLLGTAFSSNRLIVGNGATSGTSFSTLTFDPSPDVLEIGDPTSNGAGLTLEANGTEQPVINIDNYNTAADAGILVFQKRPTDNSLVLNDDLGSIIFQGEDSGGTLREGATIVSNIVSQGASSINADLLLTANGSFIDIDQTLRVESTTGNVQLEGVNIFLEATSYNFDNTLPTLANSTDSLLAVTAAGQWRFVSKSSINNPIDLNDLTDVIISGPSNGQQLVYDGSNWLNQTIAPAAADNFAEADLTFDANRDHDLNAFDLAIRENADTLLFLDASAAWVGVGTNSPGFIFDVVGSNADDINIQTDDADSQVGFRMSNDARTWRMRVRGTNSDAFEIRDITAGANRLVIEADGDIGIGVDAPERPLHIANGSAGFSSILLSNTFYYGIENSSGTNIGVLGMTGADHVYMGAIENAGGSVFIREDGVDRISIQNGAIGINNATAPVSSPADMVQLFAEDVSASSELKVRDEAGNTTTLSPHNFSKIPGGPSEKMAWAYYSEKDDEYVNVDMLKLARLVEELTGEKLVYKGKIE